MSITVPEKLYHGQIPFDKKTGHLLTWVGPWHKDVVWQDNEPFVDTYVVDGFDRGRSSISVRMHRPRDGQKVSLFLSDFSQLFFNNAFKGVEVTCTWCFCKRGANYGIMPLEVHT